MLLLEPLLELLLLLLLLVLLHVFYHVLIRGREAPPYNYVIHAYSRSSSRSSSSSSSSSSCSSICGHRDMSLWILSSYLFRDAVSLVLVW